MIDTTFDDVDVWLLSYAPHWGIVKCTFEIFSRDDLGLSQREGRRAMASKLRSTIAYGTVLAASDSAAFRAALAAHDNRPVLCPFWPAMTSLAGAAGASVQGGLRVWFEPDWSDWEIGTGEEPTGFTPSTAARTAPLMWGRFDKFPDRSPENPKVDEAVSFTFLENGPADYALSARTIALTLGASVGGVDTPVLTAPLHWGKQKATIDVRVEREQIGYGRAEVEDYADQTPRTRQTLIVRATTSDEVALLLRLFEERAGKVKPWWSPAVHSWEAADRFLARFRSNKLTVTWGMPAMDGTREQAEASIEILAVPTESTVPGGETVGTTIGALAAKWWGYVVTDGNSTWKLTSYDAEIDAGGLGVFTAAPISHKVALMELNLVRHDADLTVGPFAGSPFSRMRIDVHAPGLTVQIYEGTIASPSTAALIFTGKVRAPKFRGAVCTCKVSGLTALGDTRVPMALTAKRCWVHFGSELCGADVEALSVDSDLAEIDVDGQLVFNEAGAAGFPATPADHFRFGYAERLLADGTKQRYRVLGNDVVNTDGETNYVEIPFYSDNRVNGGSAYDNFFRGVVRIWESGTIEYDGEIRWTGPSARDIRVWVGPNKTSGAYHTIGTAPGGGTWVPCYWYLRPAAGEYVHHIFGNDTSNTNQRARIFSYPDGLLLPYTWGDGSITVTVNRTGNTLEIDGSSNSPSAFVWTWSAVNVSTFAFGGTFAGYGNFVGIQTWDIDHAIPNGGGTTGVGFRIGENNGFYYNTWGTIAPIQQTAYAPSVQSGTDPGGPGASSITVRTLGAVTPAPSASPEEDWKLVPACNKSFERCTSLGNANNHRGLPHFPLTNPALVPIKQETPRTSKK